MWSEEQYIAFLRYECRLCRIGVTHIHVENWYTVEDFQRNYIRSSNQILISKILNVEEHHIDLYDPDLLSFGARYRQAMCKTFQDVMELIHKELPCIIKTIKNLSLS